MNDTEKVLVTGGAGSVGVCLSRRLAGQGKQVVIADNFFRGKRDADFEAVLALSNVTLIETDLTKREGWDVLGTGYEHIYQLAGVNGTKLFYSVPGEVLRIGVTTVLHSLEWMKDTNPNAKILYTSSNEAYAGALASFNQLPIPTPEAVPLVISDAYNARWTYAGTKLIGELFYIHYAKEHNLRSVIVRPHNFYGPRTGYDHVIPEFIERIQKKVSPFPIYGADDTRTFCYMEDAVEAMQMVMGADTPNGETYHIGRPYTDETSMEDLAQTLFKIAGWTPSEFDIKNGPEGSVKRRAADVSKIERDTGWKARTTLEEGLRKTLEWYNQNPKTE
jgi:nucleoside-diphosphate-sugar epimerase